MKRLLAAAATLWVITGCASAQSLDEPTGAVAASPAGRQRLLAGSILSVGMAPDPQAASAAYAAGAAVDRNNLQLNQAFVRRMVDLGVPEAAGAQAQIVARLAPDDGLALAVIGYSQAAAGDMPQALQSIVSAAYYRGEDPFVLRTAGQLAAWLDRKPKEANLPKYLQDAMTQLAAGLAENKVFASARTEAASAYAELAAAEAQAAAQPEIASGPAAEATGLAGPATAPAAAGAWETMPLPPDTAQRDVDVADVTDSAPQVANRPAADAAPASDGGAAQGLAPWGEFAPGVVLPPLQRQEDTSDPYAQDAAPPGYVQAVAPAAYVQAQPGAIYAQAQPAWPYTQTVVNVFNEYDYDSDYYYPLAFDDDYGWYDDQVVFLGHFHRHGLLLGRCRHRDVIIDHHRHVYVGDARNVVAGPRNADHFLIDRARQVTAGDNHQLVVSHTPRTLLADNKGAIVASRIETAAGRQTAPAMAGGAAPTAAVAARAAAPHAASAAQPRPAGLAPLRSTLSPAARTALGTSAQQTPSTPASPGLAFSRAAQSPSAGVAVPRTVQQSAPTAAAPGLAVTRAAPPFTTAAAFTAAANRPAATRGAEASAPARIDTSRAFAVPLAAATPTPQTSRQSDATSHDSYRAAPRDHSGAPSRSSAPAVSHSSAQPASHDSTRAASHDSGRTASNDSAHASSHDSSHDSSHASAGSSGHDGGHDSSDHSSGAGAGGSGGGHR